MACGRTVDIVDESGNIGKESSSPNPGIIPEDLRKHQRTPDRMAGTSVEIRTQYLYKAAPEPCL
jgi:hypothetical protein